MPGLEEQGQETQGIKTPTSGLQFIATVLPAPRRPLAFTLSPAWTGAMPATESCSKEMTWLVLL